MKNNLLKLICGERGYIDKSPVITQSFISVMFDQSISSGKIPNTIVIDIDKLENKIREIEIYDSKNKKSSYKQIFNEKFITGMQVNSEIIPIEIFKTKILLPLCLMYEKDCEIYLFSYLRILNNKILFIFSGKEFREKIDKNNLLTLFQEKHRQNALFFNNHQCYYNKLFKGEEIEYKYTLPKNGDIWKLTQDFYNDVKLNKIPEYIPEFGDEFQSWDYENYLFEINSPIEERGYISFIPLTKGGYTIKRKWFSEDSVKRREVHYKETEKISDYKKYIHDRFGVTGRELPSFQRIRYDVNFESILTGHVFGVYFDYSYLHSDETKVLCQCELEYIRTRSINRNDEREMLEQFNELANYMDKFFKERAIPTNRGVYSKLSFLKNCIKENNDD
ncbi:hypothetical protein FCT18_20240 [Lysinibacillus sphaericus]|uniref:Uncharacterized protein n=2 Tax=Lysinibacillus TaxID=400634 RepID=A0A2S0K097_LYSSH|nr:MULTISPECIES: hypothetical protein [Lysinibacillus]AHN24192.1 hypothetical protein T479_11570 [Lysinibacillus varians]AVK96830.1 hypothetical protein LS41612_11450 [Lysinibacillus sphaericus]MED4545700.1 hypothetical protein [Lysinibacillus sphaericus]TKI16733.1 hypothetical protein FCT18_20240 [Lysinibacillus sphaericus]TKI50946.1 hypothetical protein FC752_22580 [Lysinibacillus varians]